MPALCLILIHGKMPCIELQIQKKNHLFIVDTGCTVTTVSVELGQMLKFGKTSWAIGIGGKEDSVEMSGSFNLLGKTLQNIHASHMINNLGKEIGIQLSGLLGQDLFKQFDSVEFDYKNGVVRFKNGG